MLWVRSSLLILSLALTGCFTPLYGVKRDGTRAQDYMKQTDVAAIGGRVGVLMRNELVFNMTGTGEEVANPTYRLHVTMGFAGSLLVTDTQAGRPQAESLTLNSTFRITDVKSGLELHKGAAFASASLDTSQQRFARDRGRLDAQDRATKAVADQITTQVATYFATK